MILYAKRSTFAALKTERKHERIFARIHLRVVNTDSRWTEAIVIARRDVGQLKNVTRGRVARRIIVRGTHNRHCVHMANNEDAF